MKIAVLTSGTNNTPPMYEPLRDLGHDLMVVTYDAMTPHEHNDLPAIIDAFAPGWVLYIGAIVGHHGKPVPDVGVLAQIGAAHLLVHFCCDGAEPYWWRQLDQYYDAGRFALQVNVDGVKIGPIGDRGLTLLCPVDVTKFDDRPWNKRRHACGFAGGLHGGRAEIFRMLVSEGSVTLRDRDADPGQEGYRSFLEDCRVGINAAYTGGNTGQMHVKFRAAGELPAAGCLVLETEGSPLGDWFDAGSDFLQYTDANTARNAIAWSTSHADEARAIAQRLRAKVAERHSPAVFWSQVMERIGIGRALLPAREVPNRHWFHFPLPNHGAAPERLQPPQRDEPVLVGSLNAVNMVCYEQQIYAVPQRLGPIDLTCNRHHAAVRKFSDMDSIRAAIIAGAIQ